MISVLSRRAFLASVAALIAAPASAPASASPPAVMTTAMLPDGTFAVVGMEFSGRPVFAEALPARGHGIARRPGTGDLVVLARRPGRFGYILTPESGHVRVSLELPEHRHFYGHAAFSSDGRLMYTPENAFDTGRGVIGIWDAAAGYARVGEVDSAGIGPHDVERAPVGAAGSERIWVANGGILTHPDSGRTKLNVPTMSPSLALFDPAKREVETVLTLPRHFHKLSMRHLAAGPDAVCVAMQDQGPEGVTEPLLCLRTGNGETRLLELPDKVALKARGYCGDVALDAGGKVVGAGFPRGGFFAFWTVEDGRPLGVIEAVDGCGIASAPKKAAFCVSTGTGRVGHIFAGRDGVSAIWNSPKGVAAFDNHLLVT